MLSNKPYLMRAFYDWIVDSGFTPLVVLNADYPKIRVPAGFAENGEIVFNISPGAIRDLKIVNTSIEFKASFSGVIHFISAPIKAVNAIYAEENGEGIFFDDADLEEDGGEGVQLRGIEGSANISAISHNTRKKKDDNEETLTDANVRERPVLTLIE